MNKSLGKIFLLSSLFLLICLGCTSCKDNQKEVISLKNEGYPETETDTNETDSEDSYEKIADANMFVYVTGQVKNPGVYPIGENTRIYEVIELAGGFAEKAATGSLNLAEKVSDGQQIKVLSKSEYKKLKNADKESAQTEMVDEQNEKSSLVNINTASLEELMTLPGIGQTKAEAIIRYREEKGMFSSIEDIMQISGIKEASFNRIKLLIRI